MKRFFSALLAVVLIVACFATVASAVQVQPGETRTFTVTVQGDEFANYGVALSADNGLTITEVKGATYGGGVAAWASATNVTQHSFTVTVKIADDLAPGTYKVYASVTHATKDVGVDNDTDNIKDGFVAASVSANGASFEIVAPPHEHTWGEWKVVTEATCTAEGLEERVCSSCGEKETRAIAMKPHTLGGWMYDTSNHWHECSVCHTHVDVAGHFMNPVADVEPNEQYPLGGTRFKCSTCPYSFVKENTPIPQVGDIRPMIFLGIAGVVTMLAAVSYVFKRKSVI